MKHDTTSGKPKPQMVQSHLHHPISQRVSHTQQVCRPVGHQQQSAQGLPGASPSYTSGSVCELWSFLGCSSAEDNVASFRTLDAVSEVLRSLEHVGPRMGASRGARDVERTLSPL